MQKRLPPNTETRVWDPNFEKLLTETTEALVRAMSPRRARRLHGLLTEFRDEGGTVELQTFYRRLVAETFFDAISRR